MKSRAESVPALEMDGWMGGWMERMDGRKLSIGTAFLVGTGGGGGGSKEEALTLKCTKPRAVTFLLKYSHTQMHTESVCTCVYALFA